MLPATPAAQGRDPAEGQQAHRGRLGHRVRADGPPVRHGRLGREVLHADGVEAVLGQREVPELSSTHCPHCRTNRQKKHDPGAESAPFAHAPRTNRRSSAHQPGERSCASGREPLDRPSHTVSPGKNTDGRDRQRGGDPVSGPPHRSLIRSVLLTYWWCLAIIGWHNLLLTKAYELTATCLQTRELPKTRQNRLVPAFGRTIMAKHHLLEKRLCYARRRLRRSMASPPRASRPIVAGSGTHHVSMTSSSTKMSPVIVNHSSIGFSSSSQA